MTAYLDRHHAGLPTDDIVPHREARAQVIVPNDDGVSCLFELIVDITAARVVSSDHLKGKHSYIDSAYMKEVETACMADARIQAEVKKLRLPDGATVCVEPWAYATDGMNDMSQRTTMV